MQTEYQGLSQREVIQRRTEFGLNILPEAPPPSNLSVFLSQLKNPLVYVLLFASILTILINHISDTIIILFAVILNTTLGYIQERKASLALRALKKYITHSATVIRDGKQQTIHTTYLVPGDIVLLHQGSAVPADGILLSANRLYMNEAMLTGESVPVLKKGQDEVSMGTTVSSGQGIFTITHTGAQTKMGEIAQKIQKPEELTPLQKQLKTFSSQLVRAIAILLFFVIAIGLLYQFSMTELFVTAIALAVSSIPEGLLVSLTVVLAIGMQRILKRRGLVKKLAAAETLGGVTVICIDKTGTLTQGSMEVVEHIGNAHDLATQVVLANDLDDPMMIAAFAWGKKEAEQLLTTHKKIDNIPFSPKERFSTSLYSWTDKNHMLFVNGAPELLLSFTNLDPPEKDTILETINTLTKHGKRLIGFVRKEVGKEKTEIELLDATCDMTWVGMLAFFDPVRPGVEDAILQAHTAGIKTIVITGDYPNTSKFVLSELGTSVSEQEIITGDQLQIMNDEELKSIVSTTKLFARTTPDQKLRIVNALKKTGEIVAMMGDGVNDAPALHAADIGIVVGEATDVAKESADLILLDSNFATIIAAIEEGRGMFENIRKIILYLLSDAFAEIIVIIGGILLRLPLPLIAVQILWINLVSDGFPNLALTVDPKRKSIMNERPRQTKEPLITKWMMILVSIVCCGAGFIALASFLYVYTQTGDAVLARSFTFLVLGFNSLAYVFSIRTLTTPFWKSNPFENKWLILAVGAGFFLQVLPFTTPPLRQFFGITTLTPAHWMWAIIFSVSLFIIVEMIKGVYRIKRKMI